MKRQDLADEAAAARKSGADPLTILAMVTDKAVATALERQCRICGDLQEFEICDECHRKGHSERDDPSDVGLPGPEVYSDFNYGRRGRW